jgi:hypothetical protein
MPPFVRAVQFSIGPLGALNRLEWLRFRSGTTVDPLWGNIEPEFCTDPKPKFWRPHRTPFFKPGYTLHFDPMGYQPKVKGATNSKCSESSDWRRFAGTLKNESYKSQSGRGFSRAKNALHESNGPSRPPGWWPAMQLGPFHGNSFVSLVSSSESQ